MAGHRRPAKEIVAGQDQRTHAESDGLGKNEVDAQPPAETKMGEEKSDDGVEHRSQGK
jgi:hypothetical protein